MTQWYARTSAEKARARRLIAAGKARKADTIRENERRNGRLVGWETWLIEEIEVKP